MGLFSFLKNAGAKIFNRKNEAAEAAEAAADAAKAEALRRQKISLLENVVSGLELPIENMSLELEEDKVTVYGQTPSQRDKEKVVLALGNVTGIATVDDRISVVEPEPESQFYEVKSGDTLGKIAKEYYGDPMKYPIIFEANKPMLADPNLIYPGQVLRIPPIS
ncbi:MAG: peptidoglycan-binding protein LysM [Bacteroidota bacterium]